MISKIKLQINLMLELFVFKVGIVRIDFKIWFMSTSTFFFQICDFKFLPNFLLSTFFFEFAQFFPFFP